MKNNKEDKKHEAAKSQVVSIGAKLKDEDDVGDESFGLSEIDRSSNSPSGMGGVVNNKIDKSRSPFDNLFKKRVDETDSDSPYSPQKNQEIESKEDENTNQKDRKSLSEKRDIMKIQSLTQALTKSDEIFKNKIKKQKTNDQSLNMPEIASVSEDMKGKSSDEDKRSSYGFQSQMTLKKQKKVLFDEEDIQENRLDIMRSSKQLKHIIKAQLIMDTNKMKESQKNDKFEVSQSVSLSMSSNTEEPLKCEKHGNDTNNSLERGENFCLDELDSLQDVVNNDLLTKHFVNSKYEAEKTKKELLARHAKQYGYVKFPEKTMKKMKDKLLKKSVQEYNKRQQELDHEILQREIAVTETQQQMRQLDDVNGAKGIGAISMLIKMYQSKIMQLRKQKVELEKEEKQRLYATDLNKSHDHDHYDLIYSENYYKTKKKHNQSTQYQKHAHDHSQPQNPEAYLMKEENSIKYKQKNSLVENTKRFFKRTNSFNEEISKKRKPEEQKIIEEQLYNNSDKNSIQNIRKIKTKYTLRADTQAYRFWNMFIGLNCLYTSLSYPSYTMNGFPVNWTEYITLIFSEFCFFVDIVLSFFTQKLDEEGKSQHESLETVATDYLNSNEFKVELIAFIPWGYIATSFDPRLKFIWVIKALRIGQLNYYIRDSMIMPIINSYIEKKQLHCLNDIHHRDDIDRDQTFIIQRIYISNIIKIMRLVLQVLFISYFMGQYWYIFSETVHEFQFNEGEGEDGEEIVYQVHPVPEPELTEKEKEELKDSQRMLFGYVEDEFQLQEPTTSFLKRLLSGEDPLQEKEYQYQTFIHYYGSWSIRDMSNGNRVLTSTYFSFTTLSTVGLGDYYPVSDTERLVGSFFLLMGVAIFSYMMGELLERIIKIQTLDTEIGEEDDLDKFFVLLRLFNNGQCIDHHVQSKIRTFMEFKWVNDKNNFLTNELEVKQFYGQLPVECQRMLYTDFIYNDFLFKFRRFFSFRIPDLRSEDQCNSARNKNSKVAKKIKESKLHIMKRKISMIMSLNSAMRNKDPRPKQSKEEIAAMTERFRQRVKKMEEKKNAQDIQNKIDKVHKQGKRAYEYQTNIKFPFLTFMDDNYSEFMTLLMQNLEVRYFDAGDSIAQELEECLEVLFVVQGTYNVGYEINKIERYRKQFGSSTLIGCFNLSFQKRNEFLFKAQSNMVCYAIRKKQWNEIMHKFPQFYLIIKNKSLAFYFTKIFRPLLNLKQNEIEFFERRKDYRQVLAISDLKMDDIKGALARIYSDSDGMVKQRKLESTYQAQVSWLIKRIEQKINNAALIALEITRRSEHIQEQLWDKVITALQYNTVKQPILLVSQLYNIIVPIELQYDLNIDQARGGKYQLYLDRVHQLSQRITGKCIKEKKNGDLKSYLLGQFKQKLFKQVSRQMGDNFQPGMEKGLPDWMQGNSPGLSQDNIKSFIAQKQVIKKYDALTRESAKFQWGHVNKRINTNQSSQDPQIEEQKDQKSTFLPPIYAQNNQAAEVNQLMNNTNLGFTQDILNIKRKSKNLYTQRIPQRGQQQNTMRQPLQNRNNGSQATRDNIDSPTNINQNQFMLNQDIQSQNTQNVPMGMFEIFSGRKVVNQAVLITDDQEMLDAPVHIESNQFMQNHAPFRTQDKLDNEATQQNEINETISDIPEMFLSQDNQTDGKASILAQIRGSANAQTIEEMKQDVGTNYVFSERSKDDEQFQGKQ